MSIHRLAAVVLVPLLAAPPAVSVAAADPPAPAGSTLEVAVDSPRACVVAGEHPQVQGTITPMSGVRRARLFFRSALSADFYYVEAVLAGGRSIARLPCALPGAGSISFYLDATGDGSGGRSADGDAIVVRRSDECSGDRTVAPISPGGPVRVFDVAGNPAFPAGFGGVAGGGPVCEVARPVAAAGRNFFGTTTGLATLAAAGLGIAAIIIVSNDNQPTSPSR